MNREGQKVPQVTFRTRAGNGEFTGGLEELEKWSRKAA